MGFASPQMADGRRYSWNFINDRNARGRARADSSMFDGYPASMSARERALIKTDAPVSP